jgi:hypothetical protein
MANNEDKKIVYQELVWLSIVKQIYDFAMEKIKEKEVAEKKNNLTKEEKEVFSKLKDFNNISTEYKNNYHRLKGKDQKSLNKLLKNLETFSDELFREIKKLPEKSRFDY